jgi:hypothetical protein
MMPERIPDIMEENREQGRRIASLEASVQDLTQRVPFAENLKRAKFTVYDNVWRRKKGE